MDRLRTLLAWLVVVTLLLAQPVAGLGSCRRCPPDCPMHARAAEPAGVQPVHEAHGAGHHHVGGGGATGGTAVAHAGGAKRCHEPAPRAPEDQPCLSGVCGHMDAAAAPVLPDGALLERQLVAVAPAALACLPSLVLLHGVVPRTPPTEPPRALLV
jgi:hypothetical protein